MIVSDLDNTLFGSDRGIQEFARAMLKHCRKSGFKTVYATGRGSIVLSELFGSRITAKTAHPLLTTCDWYRLKISPGNSNIHYSNFLPNKYPKIVNFRIADFQWHKLGPEKLLVILNNSSETAFVKNTCLKYSLISAGSHLLKTASLFYSGFHVISLCTA